MAVAIRVDRIEWYTAHEDGLDGAIWYEVFRDGEYLFPFNDITVRIGAPDAAHRGLYEAAFADSDALAGQIREALTDAGARAPDLRVAVQVLEGVERPVEVECLRRATAPGPSAARPAAKLIVLRGSAEETELEIRSDRVHIGRLREVPSESGGLRRRNDIAFADSEKTVSREHASIRYDAVAGRFRLYDCLSQRGARIFRDGRRIDVPCGDTRGVQLQSGDEIHLGEARLRFEM